MLESPGVLEQLSLGWVWVIIYNHALVPVCLRIKSTHQPYCFMTEFVGSRLICEEAKSFGVLEVLSEPVEPRREHACQLCMPMTTALVLSTRASQPSYLCQQPSLMSSYTSLGHWSTPTEAESS